MRKMVEGILKKVTKQRAKAAKKKMKGRTAPKRKAAKSMSKKAKKSMLMKAMEPQEAAPDAETAQDNMMESEGGY